MSSMSALPSSFSTRPPAPFLSSSTRSASTSRLLSQRPSPGVKLSLLQVDASSATASDSGASTAPSGPSFQASLNAMVQTTTGLMTASPEGAFASALEDLQMWQKEGAAQQQPQGEDKQAENQTQQQSTQKKAYMAH